MNLSKNLIAVGGAIPLGFLPDKQVVEFKKCKKCGSRDTIYEEIVRKTKGINMSHE